MTNNKNMRKKLKIFNSLIYLCFSIIIIRLFYLQIISRNDYLEILSSKTSKIIYGDTSLRGRIYDTNNNLLVDNQLIMTIVYQRENGITRMEEVDLAYQVSEYIELDYSRLTDSYLKDFYILMNEDEVNKLVTNQEYKLYKNREITFNEYYKLKKSKISEENLKIYTEKDKKAIYLYYLMTNGYSYMEKTIKENCTMKEFMFFSENNSNLHGFDTKYNYGRIYLYGDTFKSILGSVGSIPSDNKDYYLARGYNLSDRVGLTNIEFVYDDLLKGERELYRYSNGDKILLKEGKRGQDLVLTVDIKLQEYVDDVLEREVKKAKKSYNTKYYKHSYVTITDTYGGILSMNGKEIIKSSVVDVSIGNITDTITAGSVVKGASILVGYDTGAIKIGEVMYDECMKIKSTPKKCSVYKMGSINDLNALAFSSNVYQFKTAIKVGGGKYVYNQSLKVRDESFDIYREYFARFGLGVNTGIELLNESRGYKGSTRNAGLLMDFAIGQYDTYTNMQLNQYISTIARNGKRYRMHLLKEVIDSETGEIVKKIEPEVLNEVNIPNKYIKRVQAGLKAVTTYGTGKNYVRVSASGKTGTSESFYDSNNDGKIDTETTSTSFVMYMPSVNPYVAISITSPNISDKSGNYKYPINQNVIKNITNNINRIIK